MTASLARRGPPLASIESLLRWTLHILQHTNTSFFYNFLEGMFFLLLEGSWCLMPHSYTFFRCFSNQHFFWNLTILHSKVL